MMGSFVLVVGLLTLTPGMDTALILRTAVTGMPGRAWGVILGIQTGTLIWGALTSAGVTALLTASHLAYEVLRWAGAAYLVWIGLGMLRDAVRRRPAAGPVAETPGGFLAGWRRGLLTNLLNPKMGAFYVALLPQFMPAGAFWYGVGLTAVHVLLGVTWSAVLVLLAGRLRSVLRRPLVARGIDAVAGTVVAAFGLRLAVSRP
jgi:threonine/homoserine/homoserine lactone efflux protein